MTGQHNISEEQKITEELNNITKKNGQDNGQGQSTRPQNNWPMHERCVHGEINDISVPLERSEVLFRIISAEPKEIQPFSQYFFREWSEVAHILMPTIADVPTFGCRFSKG